MELPLRDDQLAAIETILQGSHNFHGRVSTTHQVQVALDAPQHRGLAPTSISPGGAAASNSGSNRRAKTTR